MATKFLDYTGLSHLWSKFKEWCNSIFVTKTTDENITGIKTFVGSKKIAFKQSGANDKLGFTLFNNSGNEQGYLEYNPTNKIAGVPLMTLGNYATATDELTYVGFRRYSNISGASGAYNLLTPLISDAKNHFNLTTTYTNFYLPLGISDGTNIVTADNSGVININSLFPSTYASSAINLLTGYSKPSTGSALATTDTLNQALGKLEAKVDAYDDSNYVHKTENELVQGIKTFKNAHSWTTGGAAALSSIQLQSTIIERSSDPAQNSFTGIVILDKNAVSDLDHVNRLGSLEFGKYPNSTSFINVKVYKPNDTSNEATGITVGYDANGVAYAVAPSTSSSRLAGGDIVTRDWIPNDIRIVHKTGNETIDGIKTFSSTISGSVSGSAGSLANSKPSYGMWLYYRSGQLPIGTSDDNTYNGSSSNYKLWSFPANGTVSTSTVANIQNLRLVWDSSYFTDIFVSPNNHWIWHRDVQNLMPTPWRRIVEENATGVEATTWDISIAGNAATATALVDDSNYVHKIGDENISGTKIFNSYLSTNNNLGLQKATGESYILSNFSGLATRTSNPSSNCTTAYILRANDGNFVLGTYMQIYTNGDVRHYFRHNHYSDSESTGLVFYSYEALAEGYLTAQTDNKYRLGIPDHRWSAVYAATASIQTSDIRMKDDISELPQNLLDAWENIQWLQFKFKDSIEEKGNNARLHTGSIAQSVDAVLKANNINASDYGFFCYDKWKAKEATYDDNGQVLDEAQEAGDRYSLRYEEMFAVEAAYQRRKNKILEDRISELEKRLAKLEGVV